MAKTYSVQCKVSIPRAGEFEVELKIPDDFWQLRRHLTRDLTVEDLTNAADDVVYEKLRIKVLNAPAVLKQIKKYRGG